MGLAQASHGPESDLPGPGLGLLDPGVGLSGPGSGLMGGGDVRMDERMNRQQTDGVSPHSTGLCPLSGSLPKKKNHFHHVAQGYFEALAGAPRTYNTP